MSYLKTAVFLNLLVEMRLNKIWKLEAEYKEFIVWKYLCADIEKTLNRG